jgi:hypothetical protein
MKIVRTPAPPAPKSRSILRFDQPAPAAVPASDKPTPSNECAAHAVSVASSPGGIDPRQMHN